MSSPTESTPDRDLYPWEVRPDGQAEAPATSDAPAGEEVPDEVVDEVEEASPKPRRRSPV
jgi:hypothetical protein